VGISVLDQSPVQDLTLVFADDVYNRYGLNILMLFPRGSWDIPLSDILLWDPRCHQIFDLRICALSDIKTLG